MFRLVKELGTSNISRETVLLPINFTANLGTGSLAVSRNGQLEAANGTVSPGYVVINTTKIALKTLAICYPITENMVFLVESDKSTIFVPGMSVGISSSGAYDSDFAVFSSNGKGVVMGLHEDPNFIYVRFNKS